MAGLPVLGGTFAACLVAVAGMQGEGNARRICLSTPGFEVYTTESEALARDAVMHLESVRAFFERHAGGLRPPPDPVRVLGFSSPEQYRPHSPAGFATAHFQAAPERETIVTSSLARAAYPAAVHEYVHLLARRAGWSLPLWLSEGLAEFYSTLQPLDGGAMRLGAPPAGHLRVLRERPWIGLEELLAAGRASPYYSDPRLVPLFYAQSWALTHMLALSDPYRRDFPSLVSRLASGGTELGRPLEQVRKDLTEYLARGRIPSEMAVPGPGRPLPRPLLRSLDDLQWGLVLAEQLAGLDGSLEAGLRAYQELGERYPARWEPAAALGYLALGRGNLAEARRQFDKAFRLRATDPKLLLDYAELLGGQPDRGDRTAILRRALELRPGDQEIQRRLALTLYDALDFEAARDLMRGISRVSDEHASEFYRAQAYVNDRLGLKAEARSSALRASDAARTPEESDAARSLLEFVSRPPVKAPPEVVAAGPQAVLPEPSPVAPAPAPAAKPAVPLYALQAELVQFDCLGRDARLVVRARGERMAFRVEYPDGLVVRRGGAPVLRFMPCGPLKAERVTVRYQMKREASLGTLGVVRALEYR